MRLSWLLLVVVAAALMTIGVPVLQERLEGNQGLEVEAHHCAGGHADRPGCPTPTPAPLPTATAEPTATATPASTPTPTPTPTPGPVSDCASRHATYTVVGPDGNTYPTWHPQNDGVCAYDHDHGDNPTTSNVNPSLPAFGYIGALAGKSEPHNGFKVMVANRGEVNDEGRTMLVNSRALFHMGTGGPARFDEQFHSFQYDMKAVDSSHEIHIQGMADTGIVVSICERNAGAGGGGSTRTVVTLPGTGCDLGALYEVWSFDFEVYHPNPEWPDWCQPCVRVFSSLSAFDPITLMDPADHSRLLYTADYYPGGAPYHGCDREIYHGPVHWYNGFGPVEFQTDAYGFVQAGGPLTQYISAHDNIGIPFTSDQTLFKQRDNYCAAGLGLQN